LSGADGVPVVKKVTNDQKELLAFYNFLAEHWIHPQTTNPIESTSATVRLRTKVTRGAASRTTALAMAFKPVESAQPRWRALSAPHPLALVRAGARFERGPLVERPQPLLREQPPSPACCDIRWWPLPSLGRFFPIIGLLVRLCH
jgi:hypothetical protein